MKELLVILYCKYISYLSNNSPDPSTDSISQFRKAVFTPGKKALGKLQFINNTSPMKDVLKDQNLYIWDSKSR